MEALGKVVEKIMHWYQKLRTGQFQQVEEAYHSNLLGYQTEGLFRDDTGIFSGKITGVDVHGRLLINTGKGQLAAYELKQVRFVW